MKAKLLALASLASLFLLNGCNGIGDKDTLLARIDKEKVYQEDYDLFLKNLRAHKIPKNERLYQDFYSKAALVSKALSEYPSLEQEWKSWFKQMEPRALTTVFQLYYVNECLAYSESELRQFYDANRSLFPEDSVGDFRKVRGKVARLYDLSKHRAEYEKKKKKIADSENPDDSLRVQAKFFEYRLQEIQKNYMENVRDEQHVVVNPLPDVNARDYYNRHKEQFMTVPGYEVYHIQADDSLALANMFAETPTLEQFKLAAVANSKNEETSKDSGYVGRVKKDYALPYGIGMVEKIAELDGQSEGYVSTVLRAQNGRFHKFYLVKQIPSELKRFDRVEKDISVGFKTGRLFEVDSSFVLITKNGKPVMTERDLLYQNSEFYRRDLNADIHSRMVEMFANFYAFAAAAEDIRLNHSWEYRAIVRGMRLDYISDLYFDKLVNGDKVSDERAKALFEKIGNPEKPGESFENSKGEMKKLLAMPENLYKRLYYLEYQMSSVGKTYEQTIYENYMRINSQYQKAYSERLAAQSYAEATVHLYDTSIPEYKKDLSVSAMMARADSLNKAGEWRDAVEAYRLVLLTYADDDSVFEKASYECAYILGENNEYWPAEMEYYTFYKMWPNSPNAEKAMFSRAFILNENLKRNNDARQVLEEFLQKYPNSELRESAQWLLDNIKSNGKLADELMKKIEAEE